jgi:hypothetical protein
MPSNELYFVVLPLIHLSNGLTEQTLTLLPGREFATEFFPDELKGYLAMFTNRTKYLTGGHVIGYDLHEEQTGNGRVIVKVIQNVS